MSNDSNEDSVRERLRALAKSQKRSDTARLKELFDEIEATLNAGVRQATIIDLLHEHGFKITARSFKNFLYRVRKARRAQRKEDAASNLDGDRVHTPAKTGPGDEPASTSLERKESSWVERFLGTKEQREAKANLYIRTESTYPLPKKDRTE